MNQKNCKCSCHGPSDFPVGDGKFHKWFAWRPVHLDSGEWVWFKFVERKDLSRIPNPRTHGCGAIPAICYRYRKLSK